MGDSVVFILLPLLGAALLVFCIYALVSASQALKKLNDSKQVVKAFGVELQVSLLGLFLVASTACLGPAVVLRYLNFEKQIDDLHKSIDALNVQLSVANQQHPLDWPLELRFDNTSGLPNNPDKIKCSAEVTDTIGKPGANADLKLTPNGGHRYSSYLPSVVPTRFVKIRCWDFANQNHLWETTFGPVSELQFELSRAWIEQ